MPAVNFCDEVLHVATLKGRLFLACNDSAADTDRESEGGTKLYPVKLIHDHPRSTLGLLLNKWGLTDPSKLRTRMSEVLRELSAEALLALKNPKLEVRFSEDPHDYSIWAYFPVHGKRIVSRTFNPRSETRVLIVINESLLAGQPSEQSKAEIRDHFGHALLYLRSPRASNECADAEKEWRAFKKTVRI